MQRTLPMSAVCCPWSWCKTKGHWFVKCLWGPWLEFNPCDTACMFYYKVEHALRVTWAEPQPVTQEHIDMHMSVDLFMLVSEAQLSFDLNVWIQQIQTLGQPGTSLSPDPFSSTTNKSCQLKVTSIVHTVPQTDTPSTWNDKIHQTKELTGLSQPLPCPWCSSHPSSHPLPSRHRPSRPCPPQARHGRCSPCCRRARGAR
jgi:hypothetical protein